MYHNRCMLDSWPSGSVDSRTPPPLPQDDWDWEQEPIREVSCNGRWVKFHPRYAFGTAAVRGNRELTATTLAYWEIQTCQNVFGTSIMFGVGDDSAATLSTFQFTNLLGADSHSYGVNHQGLAFHDGIGFRMCEPLSAKSKNCVVGILFDGPNRRISYFVDGQFMGTPFTEINISRPLYPMLSSTAQQSQFRVQNQLCFRQPATLFSICLKRVHNTFPHTYGNLPLPKTILAEIGKLDANSRRIKKTEDRVKTRSASRRSMRLFWREFGSN